MEKALSLNYRRCLSVTGIPEPPGVSTHRGGFSKLLLSASSSCWNDHGFILRRGPKKACVAVQKTVPDV